MRTILAAIDFSDVTEAVIDNVKRLAATFGSKVVLVHVASYGVGDISPGAMFFPAGTMLDERDLGSLLESARKRFSGLPVDVKTVLLDGGLVAEGILAEGADHHADLIVIGSHGHGALYNLMAVNVAMEVIKSARCPVLVVPGPRRQFLSTSKSKEVKSYASR